MIITKLKGGLGNQMFQYAIGKAVALQNNTTLKLDVSNYSQKSFRKFSLDAFNITYSLASQVDLQVFGISTNVLKNINPNFRNRQAQIFKENKPFDFDKRVFSLQLPIYLDGYWQCRKYPDLIKKTLIKEFTLKNESVLCKYWMKQVQRNNCVSIHIRRGDMANNKNTQKTFGNCSLQYYQKAINMMRKRFKGVYFYAFSDDLCWVQNNLWEKDLVLVDIKNEAEAMIIMSKCRHQIIANSTFSWWAAWLNSYKDKIVIAPTPWRRDHLKVKNLLYPEWKKIPTD